MAEPTTVNVALITPNTGDLPGTWGSAAINPDLVAIDGFLGGVQTISVAAAPVTLTVPAGFVATPGGGPTQAQNGVLRFTGALSTDVPVTLPMPGYMIIENLTTGAHVLSFRAIGSGEVIGIEQGSVQHIYNDGTNVRFVNLPNVGTYWDICDATVPAWIAACTKPPWLLCDGSAFNPATYPYLSAKLGQNTTPDFRGSPRYMLNLGTSRITAAVSGLDGDTRFSLKTTQSYTLIVGNLPPYTPSGTLNLVAHIAGFKQVNFTLSAGGTGIWAAVAGNNQSVVFDTGTFGGDAQGGLSTPVGLVGTGAVSGITLIRAA